MYGVLVDFESALAKQDAETLKEYEGRYDCMGDILIDDRGMNGTSEFEGKWVQFGSERFPN